MQVKRTICSLIEQKRQRQSGRTVNGYVPTSFRSNFDSSGLDLSEFTFPDLFTQIQACSRYMTS